MNNAELEKLASKKGYSLDIDHDGMYSLADVKDNENDGFCVDYIIEGAFKEEIIEFLNNK